MAKKFKSTSDSNEGKRHNSVKQSREDRYSLSINKGTLISSNLTWTLLYN